MAKTTTGLDRIAAILDGARRPEYTGTNRCLPCTVINVGIAAALAAIVAVVSVPIAVTVFLGSLLAIYLRGYLIPGTPALTKRYLPDRVLSAFDKDPRARRQSETATTPDGSMDPLSILRAADAVRDAPDLDDVVLTPWFEAAWWDEMAELDGQHADGALLADLLDVDRDDVSFDWHGAAVVARIDGRWAGQWESRAAFVADLAAARVLDREFAGWTALPLAVRSEALGGLRLMLDYCPTCDGRIAVEQTVVESCCRSYDVIAGTCEGCDARLFELDYDHDAIPAEN